MAKTGVKTAVCDICGAEVRDGSAFCYNCGGSLTEPQHVDPTPQPTEPILVAEPVTNGSAGQVDVFPANQKVERSDRRKVRASKREPAEIVWEPRQGVSWTFVIASIIFVIIALAVVSAAVYVR